WKAILAVLANACGPVFRDELADLIGMVLRPGIIVDKEDITLIERFVLNNGLTSGYVLGYPRLAEFLREDLVRGWSKRAKDAFIEWGRAVKATIAGRQEQSEQAPIPSYLSSFYTLHLQRDADPSELFELMESQDWCRAQMATDPSGAAYILDLSRARNVAEK